MIQKTTWFGLIAVWLIAMQPAVAAPPQLTDYSLKTETLTPKSGAVKRAVIVLHASEGHSEYMRHIASTLHESLPDTVFLIPNGPFPSDTKERYHWFSEPSKKGAQDGAQALNRYIGEVKTRLSLSDEQIAVVGSSAGGMIALYTVQRRAQPMAAIVAFAATLGEPPPHGNQTPVCMIYGDKDQFFAQQVQSVVMMQKARIPVESHVRHGLGHEVDMPGVAIAAQFLRKTFKISQN